MKRYTPKQLRRAIERLPADPPVDDPKKWYKTQKEHWLGWLSEYDGPGAYGRKVDSTRDARYAYNHVVNFRMLLWLIDATGVDRDLVASARLASEPGTTLQQKSSAIRRIVPWEVVAPLLFEQQSADLLSRLRRFTWGRSRGNH